MHLLPLLATSPLPTAGPVFRVFIAFHILSAMTCIITGTAASLARKGPGVHPRLGKVFYVSLAVVCASATGAAIMRWQEDRILFVLALLTFGLATLGVAARERRPHRWPLWHGIGMGGSFVVLLSAFLLDNSDFIPLLNQIQPVGLVWFLPSAVGLPLIAVALLRYQRRRPFLGNRRRRAA